MNTPWRHRLAAPRILPLVGAAVGAVGGGAYWAGAQIWPASVAVIIAMLVTAWLSPWLSPCLGASLSGLRNASPGRADAQTSAPATLIIVFAVFIKFNALMALSAANLSFPLPANLALGLILVAGYASSSALAVSMKPPSHMDLAAALAIGFAPAALIGMPGLIGLACAIAARIAFAAHARRRRLSIGAAELDITRQMTELCFYLGTLAARSYI
jgi:cobalamin synthase